MATGYGPAHPRVPEVPGILERVRFSDPDQERTVEWHWTRALAEGSEPGIEHCPAPDAGPAGTVLGRCCPTVARKGHASGDLLPQRRALACADIVLTGAVSYQPPLRPQLIAG